jgi:hypothetical protein
MSAPTGFDNNDPLGVNDVRKSASMIAQLILQRGGGGVEHHHEESVVDRDLRSLHNALTSMHGPQNG